MSVALHGFPWDASSSYARGPAHGPAFIRSVLFSEASSAYSFSGTDIKAAITRYDFEGLPQEGAGARDAITARITSSLSAGLHPISLGGDHSITFPILKAIKMKYGAVNVLHFDAHTDLYEEFGGDPYSHASPFFRAMEEGCIKNLVQVGLRSIGPEQRQYGKEKGVTMLGADEVDAIPFERLQEPLYISIDLDGFDPAFAPGVSHTEPGGLTSREVLGVLKRLPVTPIGADIVELNPERDINLMTAHLGARLVKEVCALFVES